MLCHFLFEYHHLIDCNIDFHNNLNPKILINFSGSITREIVLFIYLNLFLNPSIASSPAHVSESCDKFNSNVLNTILESRAGSGIAAKLTRLIS